jgi:hypothetical protein
MKKSVSQFQSMVVWSHAFGKNIMEGCGVREFFTWQRESRKKGTGAKKISQPPRTSPSDLRAPSRAYFLTLQDLTNSSTSCVPMYLHEDMRHIYIQTITTFFQMKLVISLQKKAFKTLYKNYIHCGWWSGSTSPLFNLPYHQKWLCSYWLYE